MKSAKKAKQEGNYQEALKLYEKALERQKNLPTDPSTETEILLNIAIMYNATLLGNKAKNLKYLRKAEKTLQKTDNYLLKCRVAMQFGLHYEIEERYRKAENYYQKALDLAQKGNIAQETVYAKLSLASIKVLRGDYYLAIDYFESLTTELKDSPNRNRFLAVVYNNLAACYEKLKLYRKASQVQKKALDYNIKAFGKASHPAVLMYYTNLAGQYLNAEQIAKAQKELDTFFGYTSENTSIYRLTTAYKLQAQVFTKQKKYKEAKELLAKAKNLYGQNYDTKNYDVAQAYQLMAENNLAQGELEKALENIQEAFISNHQTFKDKNWQKNPPNKGIIVEDYQLELLDTKINICLKAFQKTKKDKYLKQASQVSKLALTYIDLVRQKYPTEKTVLFVGEAANEVYEKAMQISFLLWQRSKDEKYIEQAFGTAERSKSYQLLQSLNEQELRQNYQNNSLINEEFELIEKLTLLRSKNEKLTQDSVPQIKEIEENQKEIAQLQENREKLLVRIKKELPEYFQSKFAIKYISLKQVQKKLNEDESVLEYFVGEKLLFSLVIQKNKVYFTQKLLAKNWKSKVLDFRKAILKKNPENYRKLAYELYSLCFDRKIKLRKNLLIVSDDILHYLPMECLIYQKAKQLASYKTLPYLLKRHQIYYHHSATLAFQKRKNPTELTQSLELLAFAPSFSSTKEKQVLLAKREITRSDLSPLPSAEKEVKMLADNFESKTFTGKAAHKRNFKKFVENSKVIHLATHAIIDDKNALLSRVLLNQYQDNAKSDLYAYEIKSMTLKADLVTLSACNTGFGSIQKGEGIMSLSRSFMQAGAKSVLMSLWAVSDESTSKLMQLFYQNLSKGMSKDLALKEAKLQYIKSSDRNGANPYYWAGFVLIGESEPLDTKVSPVWYWLWLGLAVLLVLLLGVFLRRVSFR